MLFEIGVPLFQRGYNVLYFMFMIKVCSMNEPKGVWGTNLYTYFFFFFTQGDCFFFFF